jgi:hypothetical protein
LIVEIDWIMTNLGRYISMNDGKDEGRGLKKKRELWRDRMKRIIESHGRASAEELGGAVH